LINKCFGYELDLIVNDIFVICPHSHIIVHFVTLWWIWAC